jgi:hypothetical protein
MLHRVGEIDEVNYEMNNEVSTEVATKNGYLCCPIEDLLFTQPDIYSLVDWLSMSSKMVGVGMPKTWIPLDSQSICEVFYNYELLTQTHKTNVTLRIRSNAGMKTTNTRGHLSGMDGSGSILKG